jgi:predicted ATPase
MAGEDLTDEALDQAIDEAGRTWRLEQIKLNEKENELRALRRERDRRRREATQPAFDFNT